MPVIWHQAAAGRWTHAALAVGCSTCGAYIGKSCTTSYATGDARDPHPHRAEVAAALGFRAVAGLMEFGGRDGG